MRFVYGLIGILIGAVLIKWGEQIYNIVGQSATVEKWMGSFGGTRLFIRLIGSLLILLSGLFMFGLLDKMVGGCFHAIFPQNLVP